MHCLNNSAASLRVYAERRQKLGVFLRKWKPQLVCPRAIKYPERAKMYARVGTSRGVFITRKTIAESSSGFTAVALTRERLFIIRANRDKSARFNIDFLLALSLPYFCILLARRSNVDEFCAPPFPRRIYLTQFCFVSRNSIRRGFPSAVIFHSAFWPPIGYHAPFLFPMKFSFLPQSSALHRRLSISIVGSAQEGSQNWRHLLKHRTAPYIVEGKYDRSRSARQKRGK